MFGSIRKGLTIIAEHTGMGKRILRGVRDAKVDMQFEFRGLPSGNSRMMDLYTSCFPQKIPTALTHILNDKEFQTVLERYATKNNLANAMPKTFLWKN